jgi:hypothetical protein
MPYNTEVKQTTPMFISKTLDIFKNGRKTYSITTWKVLGFIPVFTIKTLIDY